MYCICCNKNNVHLVNHNDGDVDDDGIDELWKTEKRKGVILNVSSKMHSDGIIEVISAGYGSRNDGDQFILAICDECIKKNVENGTLLYFGSYMGRGNEEDIDKSKKIYNRRKILDELTKK